MSLWRLSRCGLRSRAALAKTHMQRRHDGILASSHVPLKLTTEPKNLESEIFLRRALASGGSKKDFMQFLRIVAHEGKLTSGLVNEMKIGEDWLLSNLKDVNEPAHILGFLGGLCANPFPLTELDEEITKALLDKSTAVLPKLEKNTASFHLLAMVAPAVQRLRYYHEPFMAALHEWSLDAAYNYHFPQCYTDGAIVAGSFGNAGYQAYDIVSHLVEECMRVAVSVHDHAVPLEVITECMWAAVSHGHVLTKEAWDYLGTKNSVEFIGPARYNRDTLDKIEVIFDALPISYQSFHSSHTERLREIRAHVRLELEYVHSRVEHVFPTIKAYEDCVGEKPLAAYLDCDTKMPQPWGKEANTKLVALVLCRNERTLRPAGHYDGMVKHRCDTLAKKGMSVAVLPLEKVRGLSAIETAAQCLRAMQGII
eukprot:scpid86314/ scgid22969/ 